MKTVDSRSGLGALILQDHGFSSRGVPDHARAGIVGQRVVGRFDAPGDIGQWQEEPAARGPLGGAQHWPRERSPIGAYQWAWPVTIHAQAQTSTAAFPTETPQPSARTPTFTNLNDALVATRNALSRAVQRDEQRPVVFQVGTGAFAEQAARMAAQQINAIDIAAESTAQLGTQAVEGPGVVGFRPGPAFQTAFVGGGEQRSFTYKEVPDPKNAGQTITVVEFVPPGGGVPGPFVGGGLQVEGPAFGIGGAGFAGQLQDIIGRRDSDGNIETAGIPIGVGLPFPASPFGLPASLIVRDRVTGAILPQGGGTVWIGQIGPGGPVGQFGVPGPARVAGSGGPPIPGPQDMIPVRGEWSPDTRYQMRRITRAPGHPEFPNGYAGITLAGTFEAEQVDLFHPTDPRIIAPAAVKNQRYEVMATPVADLLSDGRIDVARQAPIHSLMRVVAIPHGSKGGMLKDNLARQRNWIALNIGPSKGIGYGCGIWADVDPDGGGDDMMLAMPAASQGGPFDVGHVKDRHTLGSDADGHRINVLHLSTRALFRSRGSSVWDGALDFVDDVYPECGDAGSPKEVHLNFDTDAGTWRWWTRDEFSTPPTITPGYRKPPDPPPPPNPPPGPTPTNKPKPGPPTPFPGRRNRNGTATRVTDAWSPFDVRTGTETWMELGVPSLSFSPQLQKLGAVDYRTFDRPYAEHVRWRAEITPVTARLESFGAQGGTSPFLTQSGEFVLTQPRGRVAAGGTARGGLVLLPPEVTMSDVDADFAPAGVDLSDVVLLAGPGASIGAGLPDLAGGGIRSGVGFSAAADGTLVFTPYGSDGAASSDTVSITPAGAVSIATAVAPLVVASSVQVSNLNADLLDGVEGVAYTQIVTKDSAFLAGDLSDVLTAAQRQIGVRTDAGAEEMAVNIGGTIFTVGLT